MKFSIFFFLSLTLISTQSIAKPCLQDKRTHDPKSHNTFERCSPINDLVPQIIDPALSLAIKKISNRIEKNPAQASILWASFLEQLKKKIWGPSHAVVALELEKKLNQPLTPSLENQVFQTPAELQENFGRPITLPFDGWKESVIIKNGQPWQPKDKSITEEDLEKEDLAHWVAFSTIYEPIILWGTGGSLSKRLRASDLNVWISNSCSKTDGITWEGIKLDVQVIKSPNCNPQNLFMVQKPSGLFEGLSKIKIDKPVVIGALGLTALGVIALALKDKKLVIKR